MADWTYEAIPAPSADVGGYAPGIAAGERQDAPGLWGDLGRFTGAGFLRVAADAVGAANLASEDEGWLGDVSRRARDYLTGGAEDIEKNISFRSLRAQGSQIFADEGEPSVLDDPVRSLLTKSAAMIGSTIPTILTSIGGSLIGTPVAGFAAGAATEGVLGAGNVWNDVQRWAGDPARTDQDFARFPVYAQAKANGADEATARKLVAREMITEALAAGVAAGALGGVGGRVGGAVARRMIGRDIEHIGGRLLQRTGFGAGQEAGQEVGAEAGQIIPTYGTPLEPTGRQAAGRLVESFLGGGLIGGVSHGVFGKRPENVPGGAPNAAQSAALSAHAGGGAPGMGPPAPPPGHPASPFAGPPGPPAGTQGNLPLVGGAAQMGIPFPPQPTTEAFQPLPPYAEQALTPAPRPEGQQELPLGAPQGPAQGDLFAPRGPGPGGPPTPPPGGPGAAPPPGGPGAAPPPGGPGPGAAPSPADIQQLALQLAQQTGQFDQIQRGIADLQRGVNNTPAAQATLPFLQQAYTQLTGATARGIPEPGTQGELALQGGAGGGQMRLPLPTREGFQPLPPYAQQQLTPAPRPAGQRDLRLTGGRGPAQPGLFGIPQQDQPVIYPTRQQRFRGGFGQGRYPRGTDWRGPPVAPQPPGPPGGAPGAPPAPAAPQAQVWGSLPPQLQEQLTLMAEAFRLEQNPQQRQALANQIQETLAGHGLTVRDLMQALSPIGQPGPVELTPEQQQQQLAEAQQMMLGVEPTAQAPAAVPSQREMGIPEPYGPRLPAHLMPPVEREPRTERAKLEEGVGFRETMGVVAEAAKATLREDFAGTRINADEITGAVQRITTDALFLASERTRSDVEEGVDKGTKIGKVAVTKPILIQAIGNESAANFNRVIGKDSQGDPIYMRNFMDAMADQVEGRKRTMKWQDKVAQASIVSRADFEGGRPKRGRAAAVRAKPPSARERLTIATLMRKQWPAVLHLGRLFSNSNDVARGAFITRMRLLVSALNAAVHRRMAKEEDKNKVNKLQHVSNRLAQAMDRLGSMREATSTVGMARHLKPLEGLRDMMVRLRGVPMAGYHRGQADRLLSQIERATTMVMQGTSPEADTFQKEGPIGAKIKPPTGGKFTRITIEDVPKGERPAVSRQHIPVGGARGIEKLTATGGEVTGRGALRLSDLPRRPRKKGEESQPGDERYVPYTISALRHTMRTDKQDATSLKQKSDQLYALARLIREFAGQKQHGAAAPEVALAYMMQQAARHLNEAGKPARLSTPTGTELVAAIKPALDLLQDSNPPGRAIAMDLLQRASDVGQQAGGRPLLKNTQRTVADTLANVDIALGRVTPFSLQQRLSFLNAMRQAIASVRQLSPLIDRDLSQYLTTDITLGEFNTGLRNVLARNREELKKISNDPDWEPYGLGPTGVAATLPRELREEATKDALKTGTFVPEGQPGMTPSAFGRLVRGVRGDEAATAAAADRRGGAPPLTTTFGETKRVPGRGRGRARTSITKTGLERRGLGGYGTQERAKGLREQLEKSARDERKAKADAERAKRKAQEEAEKTAEEMAARKSEERAKREAQRDRRRERGKAYRAKVKAAKEQARETQRKKEEATTKRRQKREAKKEEKPERKRRSKRKEMVDELRDEVRRRTVQEEIGDLSADQKGEVAALIMDGKVDEARARLEAFGISNPYAAVAEISNLLEAALAKLKGEDRVAEGAEQPEGEPAPAGAVPPAPPGGEPVQPAGPPDGQTAGIRGRAGTKAVGEGRGPSPRGVRPAAGQPPAGRPAAGPTIRRTRDTAVEAPYEVPKTRPGLVVLDRNRLPDLAREPTLPNWSENQLGADQREGVRRIIAAFKSRFGGTEGVRNGAFLLADGTGVGKSRQEIAAAYELQKWTSKPSLIITQNSTVIAQMHEEMDQMGLPKKGRPVMHTYTDLSNKKIDQSIEYGAIIYDEAHNLKNPSSQANQNSANFKRNFELHASATPFDTIIGSVEMISRLTGRAQEDVERELGVRIIVKKKKNNKINQSWDFTGDTTEEELAGRIGDMRDELAAKGRLLRRYFPFWGPPPQERSVAASTLTDILNKERALNTLYTEMWGSDQQTNVLAVLRGFIELQKVEAAKAEIAKALVDGKRVVVVGERSNKVTFDVPDNMRGWFPDADPALTQLYDHFTGKGIRSGKMYGSGSDAKSVADAFQRGDINLVFMTPQVGGTGINLDDRTSDGSAPRHMIMLTKQYAGDQFEQTVGRISRRFTTSPSTVEILTVPGSIAEAHADHILQGKLVTMRAAQSGADPAQSALEQEIKAKTQATEVYRALREELSPRRETAGFDDDLDFDAPVVNVANDIMRDVQAGIEVRTGDALRRMQAVTTLPAAKKLMGRLRAMAPDLPIVSLANLADATGKPMGRELGKVYPLIVRGTIKDVAVGVAADATPTTLLHEITHTTTHLEVNRLREANDPLIDVAEEFRIEMLQALRNAGHGKLASRLYDIDEMITEGFTSSEVQAAAARLAMPSKLKAQMPGLTTFWQGFMRLLNRLFGGLDYGEMSFLEGIVRIGSNIAERDVARRAGEETPRFGFDVSGSRPALTIEGRRFRTSPAGARMEGPAQMRRETFTTFGGREIEMHVATNPGRAEIRRLFDIAATSFPGQSEAQEVRLFVDRDKVYAWPADILIHSEFARNIGAELPPAGSTGEASHLFTNSMTDPRAIIIRSMEDWDLFRKLRAEGLSLTEVHDIMMGRYYADSDLDIEPAGEGPARRRFAQTAARMRQAMQRSGNTAPDTARAFAGILETAAARPEGFVNRMLQETGTRGGGALQWVRTNLLLPSSSLDHIQDNFGGLFRMADGSNYLRAHQQLKDKRSVHINKLAGETKWTHIGQREVTALEFSEELMKLARRDVAGAKLFDEVYNAAVEHQIKLNEPPPGGAGAAVRMYEIFQPVYDRMTQDWKEMYAGLQELYTNTLNHSREKLLTKLQESIARTLPEILNVDFTDYDAVMESELVDDDAKDLVKKIWGYYNELTPYSPAVRRGDYVVRASVDVKGDFAPEQADRIIRSFPTRQLKVEHLASGMVRLSTLGDQPMPVYSTHEFRGAAQQQVADFKALAAEYGQNVGVKFEVRDLDVRRRDPNELLNVDPTLSAQARREFEARVKKYAPDSTHQSAMIDLLNEVVATMLPDTYIAARHVRRRFIAGAPAQDLIRNLNEYLVAFSNNMGHLEYDRQIERNLTHAENHLRDHRYDNPNDLQTARQVLREIAQKEQVEVEKSKPNAIFNIATGVTYFHMLTSGSYALVQFMQPYMLTYPYLAARYGMKAAAREMRRTTALFTKDTILEGIKRTPGALRGDFNIFDMWPVLREAIRGEPDEENLSKGLNYLRRLNLLEMSLPREIYEARSMPSEHTGLRNLHHYFSHWGNRAMDASRAIPHAVEVQNRAQTFTGTYRLEFAKNGDHEAAVQAGVDAVRQTQLDYTRENTPRFVTLASTRLGGLFRPAVQFKRYGLHMYSLIASNFMKAAGLGPHGREATLEERKVAARMLAGVFMTHGLMAGAMGIAWEPAKIAAAALFSVFGGGGDDLDRWIHRGLHELFGFTFGSGDFARFLAEGIYGGLPRALGFDVSGRMGIQNLLTFSLVDDLYKNTSVYEIAGKQIFGPFGSLIGGNLPRAYAAFAEGNMIDMAQALSPKLVRDVIGAYKLGTMGLVDRHGNVIARPEQFDVADLAAQAFGLRPTPVSNVYEAREAILDRKYWVQDRRSALLEQYWKARGDFSTRQSVQAAIQDFNRKNPRDRLTSLDIDRSMRTRREQERASTYGVYLPRSQRHIAAEADYLRR